MQNKRFYWIKLKTDFFNQETIDFLLSQENGCQYIVLYQMLCLQSANNNGIMATKVGEMIIPYDIKKIVRDTKYFDYDTVAVALELFKKLGLIYEEENKILKIANFDEMVGSEAANSNAQRQKRYRLRQKELNKIETVTVPVINSNVEIEYRDKSIDIDNIKENIKRKVFTPPSLEEVKQYCLERKNNIDAQHFIDFYSSKGWYIGKNKMKDWKACVRTWEQRNKTSSVKEKVPSWFNQEIKEEEFIISDEDRRRFGID